MEKKYTIKIYWSTVAYTDSFILRANQREQSNPPMIYWLQSNPDLIMNTFSAHSPTDTRFPALRGRNAKLQFYAFFIAMMSHVFLIISHTYSDGYIKLAKHQTENAERKELGKTEQIVPEHEKEKFVTRENVPDGEMVTIASASPPHPSTRARL